LTFDGTTLTAINNSSPQTILLSRTSATARNWALGVDGDGAFRLTDTGSGGVVNLSCGAAGITTLNSASDLVLKANNTERMRIDSSGNVLMGATSPFLSEKLSVVTGTAIGIAIKTTGGALNSTIGCWNATTTGDANFIFFATETTITVRGSITYNRTGGLTSYNTTSDYRAKTVNGSVQNALLKVALLKPSTGRMNGATQDIDFFVAHELQEVVPSAVTGEKDAVNEDNTPKLQMVDKSALIPLLTASIQELSALVTAQSATITSLTERITALEGK
jgi:hypothetical protein